MLLPDVNVLVLAFHEDASPTHHERYRSWLDQVVNASEAFGMSDIVLASFLRIVTNPRVFTVPVHIEGAIEFVAGVRGRSNSVQVMPGPRHWGIFTRLCESTHARDNVDPGAYLAALAIESGCEWVTEDRGFARFPGLRWRRPF